MRRIPLSVWLLIVLSVLLQTVPFPLLGPVPAWRAVFAWIAITPFLMALGATYRDGRPLMVWDAAMAGYLCGTLWFLGNCYWIYQTMYLYGGLAKPIALGILLLFCLYLGLYYALFAALFAAVRQSRLGFQGALWLAPFLWVAVELARARVTGFPWDLMGVTQVDNPLLTRLVPFTGVYGLSFLVVAVNSLWLVRIRIRERPYIRPLLTVAGVGVIVVSLVVLRGIDAPEPERTQNTVTLVQENLSVGTESRDNWETTTQMLESFSALSLHPPADHCTGIPELSSTVCIHFMDTRSAENRSTVPVDLIAWPESPSGFRSNDPVFRARLTELARTAGAPLVIGSLGVVPDAATARGVRVYDSANLIAADGSYAQRYDKIHLVPWGEYVPFKRLFSFADRLTEGVGDMDRGTERSIFSTGGHKIGVFICYESIFGDEVRQFVKNGAEVLVNISDDGWYGDTSAAWQHLNMVRMRAIENHRWILRSTNTGVTAAIDPYGHVTVAAQRHVRTALRAGFNFEEGLTFYTRFGDLFASGCALVTAIVVSWTLIVKKI